jgi:hypothetical protein
MAFVVRTQKQRLNRPDGIYLTVEGREWLIQEVKLTPSGNVVVLGHDPIRLENQIWTACTLDALGKMIGAE